MAEAADRARGAAARPLRVCLVGPSRDISGGQSVQLERLRDGLCAIPSVECGFIAVNPRLGGVLGRLQRVKYVRTAVTSARYVETLARELRGYDVVHAFSASYWSFLLAPVPAMAIARRLGKAVVLNYHSGEADDHLTRWRTAIPAMRLADAIAVPSDYLVDVFRRHGLAATAIANVVDERAGRYRRRTTLRPVFLSSRNLEPLYNVEGLLRAFARIQRVVPDARLIVVGQGSRRAALESLACALGVCHVEFRGWMPPERMAEVYDEADVYLNASSIDNMPNSILEAFAAGLPVVTTDAGGIPYIVAHERDGLMVACGDDAALAAAALRLLRNPDLAVRLADEARRECVARYRWDVVRDAWVSLYRHVAEARGIATLDRRAVPGPPPGATHGIGMREAATRETTVAGGRE